MKGGDEKIEKKEEQTQNPVCVRTHAQRTANGRTTKIEKVR